MNSEQLALEREAFEKAMTKGYNRALKNSAVKLDEDGDYECVYMRAAWEGWQAKALQSSEPVAECIASGSGHSIGKHGQDGGLACEWCGQEFTLPPSTEPVEKQPWPNHNWCVGCAPDDCSGCGTEPIERRKAPETVESGQGLVVVEIPAIEVTSLREPVATLTINAKLEYSLKIKATESLDAYLQMAKQIGVGEHELIIRSSSRAPKVTIDNSSDLDESHPLWLVNQQIEGLLDCEGAPEDHEDVIKFLRSTGLPLDTVNRIHRAIVNAYGKARDADRIDWLQDNYYSCELDAFDKKTHPRMVGWRFYGREGLHRDVRAIIDDRRGGAST